MNLSFTPQDILIADRSLFPFVYQLKEGNPSYSFRLIDADELLNLACFRFVNDPIPQLLANGFSYPNAKRYSLLLRMGLADKDDKAKAFLDSLPEGSVSTDSLGRYELSQGRILFLEMKDDVELHRVVEDLGFEAEDITFNDLGAFSDQKPAISKLFRDKFAQFCSIFATIRDKLIIDPEYAKKCYIQISGQADVFYARTIGSMLGIETYYRYRVPLLSQPAYAALYQTLHARGNVALSKEESESEVGAQVLALIEYYRLGELEGSIALARLYEILSSQLVNEQIGDRGILLSDSYSVQPHKEVYLTCFQDGPFYKTFTDDDYFDDERLAELGFNTSYIKTALEKRKKELYLRLNHFALISRVKEHLDEIINESPLAEELGIQSEAVEEMPADGVFTSAFVPVFNGSYLDDSFYPNKVGELKSYDSSFKGIPGYAAPPKKSYSVTNLESYVRCPYAYYMKTVLPKSDFDHSAIYLGDLCHKVLEGIDGEDYDYEKGFALGVETYKAEMAKNGEKPGPREDVIFAVTKVNFKRMVSLIRSMKDHGNLVYSYSELGLNWTLNDGAKTYSFYGIADKVSVYKNGSETFYVIADYKTGGESFLPYAVPFGQSTQLPLYAYAIQNGGAKKEVEGVFAGVGLQHVYPSKLQSAFVDKGTFDLKNGYNFVALDGVYTNNPDFWRVYDDTVFEKGIDKGTISGVYAQPKKKTFDATGAGNLSGLTDARPYSLDELIKDAIRSSLDAIRHIERGDFPIAPLGRDPRGLSENDLNCKYCPYGNICYRVIARDYKPLREAVDKYFAAKGEED